MRAALLVLPIAALAALILQAAATVHHDTTHLEPSQYAYREHSLQKPFLCTNPTPRTSPAPTASLDFDGTSNRLVPLCSPRSRLLLMQLPAPSCPAGTFMAML